MCNHAVTQKTFYSVSQKNPPPLRGPDIFHFFHKRLRIFNRFLHTYYTFLYTLDYTFLCNYPRFGRTYAILSATTQLTICSKCPPSDEVHAFTRLRKSLMALLIVVCG